MVKSSHDGSLSTFVPTTRWIALALSALAVACGGAENETELEDLATVSQAFSDSECRNATPDATISVGSVVYHVTGDATGDYENPNASKSYIWTFTKPNLTPTVAWPGHNLITGLAEFPTSAYNTQAECQGLSIHRRIYFNHDFRYSSVDFGHWDSDFGCALPRLFGNMINVPPKLFNQGDVIRVCAMAVDRDTNTVPMRVSLTSEELIGPLFTNPRIPKAGALWRIRADNASGTEYCKKRGHTRMSGGTAGGCTRSYVFFSALGIWQIAALPGGEPCSNIWTQLTCEG